MSLLPFIIGCINNSEVQDDNICKEETLSDAMPLFKIPPVSERIQTYQKILDDNILRIEGDPILRASTFGQLKEHQFKLYLSAADEPGKEDMKKVFAFTSATLSYWNVETLERNGFAVNDMFNGIPREKIGALFLVPLKRIDFWKNYYPSNASLDISMLLFNIQYDSLEEYIFPLIQRYVCWEAADRLFKANNIQVIKTDKPEDWQRIFFEYFLKLSVFEFPISGGDVIGKTDPHVPGSADEIFRLSIFFLKTSMVENSEFDYTPELEMFMRYRGRIPTLQKERITDKEASSMAGHPMIQKFVSTPVGVARVDFLNHAIFSNKSSADLAFDLDQYPTGLMIRLPPSQQQASILESMNTNQETQVSNRFTIYKPDGQYVKIIVAEAAPTDSIQISSNESAHSELTKTVSITASNETTAGRLQVVLTDPGFLSNIFTLHDISLTFLGCKLVPVAFWNLFSTNPPFSVGILDEGKILESVNRILGDQANVYLFWDNAQTNGTLNVSGTGVIPTSGLVNPLTSMPILLDLLKTQSQHECNIIFLGEFSGKDELGERVDRLGVTLFSKDYQKDKDVFQYPYIMLEAKSGVSEETIGKYLAHEFLHWIRLRFELALDQGQHFDHDQDLPQGHDTYTFNLMHPYFAEENTSLTIEQGKIINEKVAGIAGVIT